MSQTPAPDLDIFSFVIYHVLNSNPPGSAAGNAASVNPVIPDTTYRWRMGDGAGAGLSNGNTDIQFSAAGSEAVASMSVTAQGNAYLAGSSPQPDAFAVYCWATHAGDTESLPTGHIVDISIVRDYEKTPPPSLIYNSFNIDQPIDAAGYSSVSGTFAFISPTVADTTYRFRIGDGAGRGLSNGNTEQYFVTGAAAVSGDITVTEQGRIALQSYSPRPDAFSVYCWATTNGMLKSDPGAVIVPIELYAVQLNAVWEEQCNITSQTTENCTIHFTIAVNADYSLEYCLVGASDLPFGEHFTETHTVSTDGITTRYYITIANSLGPVPATNGYVMVMCAFNYLAGTSRVFASSNPCWFTPTVPPTPTISISPTQVCASTGTFITTSVSVGGVPNTAYGIAEATGSGSVISVLIENLTANYSFSPQKPSGTVCYYKYYPMVSGAYGSVWELLTVQIGEYITTINILPTTANAPALNLYYGNPQTMNITAQFVGDNCTLTPKGHFTKNTPGSFLNETDTSVVLSTYGSYVAPGDVLFCNIGYVPNYDVESTTVIPAEYRIINQAPNLTLGIITNPSIYVDANNHILKGVTFTSTFQALGNPQGDPVPPFTWTIDSGSIPPGLGGVDTGSLTGIPTAGGEYLFVLKVVDSDPLGHKSGTLSCKITVDMPIFGGNLISIAPTSGPTGPTTTSVTITGYNCYFSQSTGDNFTFTDGSHTGNLYITSWPTGVPETVIANTPEWVLPSTVTLQLYRNGYVGPVASLNNCFHYYDAGTFTLSSSPDIHAGAVPNNSNTRVAGTAIDSSTISLSGVPPVGNINWTISAGSLPNGIGITGQGVNNVTALVSGTCNVVGSYNFTIHASDSEGVPHTGELPCHIEIVAATPLTLNSNPDISSNAVSNTSNHVVVNTAMVQSLITASGSPVSFTTWSIHSGALPSQVILVPNPNNNYECLVTGTPDTVGSYDFTVKIIDSSGVPRIGLLPCHIEVTAAPFSGNLVSITPSSCVNTGGIVATIVGSNCHFNSLYDSFTFQKNNRIEVLTVNSWTSENSVDILVPNWGTNTLVDVHFRRIDTFDNQPHILASLTNGFQYNTAPTTNSILYSTPVSLIADTDFLDSAPLTITLENAAPTLENTWIKIGNTSNINPTSVMGSVVRLNKANPYLYFHIADGDIYPKPYSVGLRLDYPAPTGTLNLTADGYDIMVQYDDLTIDSPLALPVGDVGSNYPATSIIATGGNNNKVWSIASGSLPPGLNFSSSGVITGVPTVIGTYDFTVRVSCSQATLPPYSATTTKPYVIGITDSAAALQITNTSLYEGRIGSPYPIIPSGGSDAQNYIRATGRRQPYTYSIIENSPIGAENGPLPPGLTLTTQAIAEIGVMQYVGIISGTPNSSCVVTTYPVHFKVTDGSNPAYEADKWLNINILAAISTPVIDNMTPVRGPASGGIIVTINGSDFRSGIGVTFDGIPSLSVTRVGGGTTQLSVLLPAHPDLTDDKLVNVIARNSDGGASAPKTFTYYIAREGIIASVTPLDGPFDGGQTVYINGANLLGVTSIAFGIDTDYVNVDMLNTTITDAQIICTSPTYTVPNPVNYKFVNIVITKNYGDGLPPVTTTYPADGRWTNIYGTEPTHTAEGYIYRPPPRITGVIPSQGPASGGNTIYVTGDFFYCSRPLGNPPGVKIGDLDFSSDLITLVIG